MSRRPTNGGPSKGMRGVDAGNIRGSCRILHEGRGPGRPVAPCRAEGTRQGRRVTAPLHASRGASGGRRRPVCGKLARGGVGSADRPSPSRGRVFCCRPLVASLVALMFALCQTRTFGSFVARGGGRHGWPDRNVAVARPLL